jgi:hypothetical protein
VLVKGIAWEGVDWIDLAQYRDTWRAVVDLVGKLWVLSNVENFLSM